MLRLPDVAVLYTSRNVAVPNPEAVPLIVPVVGLRLAHEGRVPLDTVQVLAGHPDWVAV